MIGRGNLNSGSCKLLIKFRHGLGDNVQALIPLKHLALLRPEWSVDIVVRPRRENVFHKACNRVFNYERQPLERHYDWIYENDTIRKIQHNQPIFGLQLPITSVEGLPTSWPTHFLKDELGITPDPNLFYCKININEESKSIVADAIPDRKFAVIHYSGNTNASLKYFGLNDVKAVCELLVQNGVLPVILDYRGQSPLVDDKVVIRANIPQESGALAAFLQHACLFVGIDSGPLHVAGAVGINCVGLWERTSPEYLYAFNQNVVHYHPRGFGKICDRFRTTNNYMKSIKELL